MSAHLRRVWRAAVLTLLAFGVGAGGLLYRNLADLEQYVGRQLYLSTRTKSQDPMCRDFVSGRFKAGDPLEDLLDAYPSLKVTRTGPFTTVQNRISATSLNAFERDGVVVVAKDGRLVGAQVGPVEAFNTLTATDRAALMTAWMAMGAARASEARMSVAGPAIVGVTDGLW